MSIVREYLAAQKNPLVLQQLRKRSIVIVPGGVTVGSVLSLAVPSSFAASSYQWKRDGAAITGATSATYTLVSADLGHTITCAVSGAYTSINSVVPAAGPPVNTAAPTISGTANVGQTLTCTPGTWTNSPNLTYQWFWANTVTPISGATGLTYVPVAADVGHTLTVQETATNSRGTASQTATPTSVVTAVTWTVGNIFLAANGQTSGWPWTADTPTPPSDFTGKVLNVRSQGFDSNGNATWFNRAIKIKGRLRLPTTYPYPGDSAVTNNLSSNTCYLAEPVCSTDVMLDAGSINTSVEASPLPIGNWESEARQLIGNSNILLQVTAAHYFGIACVVFTVTDGVTVLGPFVVSVQQVLTGTDANPIIGYEKSVDCSSLNAGDIVANAKIYPNIGAAVIDSSVSYSNAYGVAITGSYTTRNFGPQKYRKNTTLYSSPIYAAVSPTLGSDTTYAISTNIATAIASPFLTYKKAYDTLRAYATGKTAGSLDGCRIELMAGNHSLASDTYFVSTSKIGVVVEAAPGESSATVTLTSTSTTPTCEDPFIRFKNITCVRGGAGYFLQLSGTTGSPDYATKHYYFNNCILNNSGQATPFINNGQIFISGGLLTPGGSNSTGFGANAGSMFSMIRGATITKGSASYTLLDSYNLVGCAMDGIVANNGTNSADNTTIGFNTCMKNNTPASPVIAISVPTAGVNVTGFALMQNAFEYINATSGPMLRLSGDGETTCLNHVVYIHNTSAGFDAHGRENMFYDESAGTTRREHKWIRDDYNIKPSTNTKEGRFVANNQLNADAPYRIKCWWHTFGAGTKGNFVQYRNASGGNIGFGPEDWGMGGNVPTTNNWPGTDPLFVNYQGTTGTTDSHGTVVAGAGGGDYHLRAGSPAEGLCDSPYIDFDLSRVARRKDGTEAAGAYARM